MPGSAFSIPPSIRPSFSLIVIYLFAVLRLNIRAARRGKFQSLSQSQSLRPTPRPFLPVPPIPLPIALTFPGIPAHLQYPLINLIFSSQSSTCIHGNKVSFSAHDNPSSPIVPSPESSPSRLHNNHTRSQHLDPLQRVFVWSEPFSGSRIVTFVFIVVLPIFFFIPFFLPFLKTDDPERPNHRSAY